MFPPLNSKQLRANFASHQIIFPCVLLAILLFLLCARVWNFGITHTDDAMWALPGYVLGKDPVADWAITQGRIWAYVSGCMMFYTLKIQGSVLGEILRLGSFVLFFSAFYWYLAVLTNRTFSLLSASTFLAFFMLKWDGSILTTYPLITWIAGLTFIASLHLSRRFLVSGKKRLLIGIAGLLFFSLFNNEGITALFTCLFFAHTLLLNKTLDFSELRFEKLKIRQRSSQLLFMFFVVAGSYAALYLGWLILHPSIYDGHTLSKFNPGRFFTTLFHFSTSSSALHDMVAPYGVSFGDAITHSGYRVEYFLTHNLQRSLHERLSLLVCLITIWLIYTLINRYQSSITVLPTVADNKQHPSATPGFNLKFAFIAGLCIALIPIIPVALTSKYQSWMAESQIRAYSHTIFSHFGWSCVYAAVLLWIADYFKTQRILRKLFIGFIALFSGLIASQAFTVNNDMAADMRNETGRWQMLKQILDINETVFHAKQVWSPRLASGTWYGTVHKEYWSDYAKRRYGNATNVTAKAPDLAEQKSGYLAHDYMYDRWGKRFVAIMAPAETPLPENKKNVSLAIYIEGGIDHSKSDYFLLLTDHSGQAVRLELPTLQPLTDQRDWAVLPNLDAKISSIRLMRLDKKRNEIQLCSLSSPPESHNQLLP